MRVLITGGLGYVGGRLVAALAKRPDVQLRVLVHGDRRLPDRFPGAVEIRRGAVEDAAGMRGLCDGVTHVVHLAGLDPAACQRSPKEGLTVSGIGTLHLAEEAAAAGIARFLFISTVHVYGNVDAPRLQEDLPLRPVNPYGVSRVAGEAVARMVAVRRGLRVVVLRLANGFGPPAFPGTQAWRPIINDFCWRAVHQNEIVLRRSGKQLRDFVAVTDIVAAIELFVGLRDTELIADTFNIGSNRVRTLLELAEYVQDEYTQVSGRRVPIRTDTDVAPEPVMRHLDMTRAFSVGFTPRTDLREEIRRTLAAAAETQAEAVGYA